MFQNSKGASPILALTLVTTAPCTVVMAQDAPAALDRVEVVGATSTDRKDAPAAKVMVTKEELARYGDSHLLDALQRIPGVTVERSGAKDAVISLRGLGAGYTQILVNGDPMPRGFSLDSIPPQLVERVEVFRTATSDMSNQAIAGTINIVLKVAASKRVRELKISLTEYGGKASPSLTFSQSEGSEQLSYGVGVGLSQQRDRWPAQWVTESVPAEGNAQTYHTVSGAGQSERRINIAPSATWKPAQGQALSLNGLFQRSWIDYDEPELRTGLSGEPPAATQDRLVSAQHGQQTKASATWKSGESATGRLELKAGFTVLSREANAHFDARDDNDARLLAREVQSALKDRSVQGSGKYAVALTEGHAAAVGWNIDRGRRTEHRIQTETSPVGWTTQDLDEGYTADVSRVGLFVQDEWEVSEQVSAYLGVRRESLTTRTVGTSLDAVRSTSAATSPTAQLLWKLPDTQGDQLRMTVAHTFKAPTAKELIPRRWVVNYNSATTPNFQGNPELRPESAVGVDLGYERYLRDGAFLGVNAFARHIRRVMLTTVSYTDGSWVETPVNRGNASVLGLEVEAKGKLKQLISTTVDMDLRSAVARYWSGLSAWNGPGSRLNRQPPVTASVGGDWRLASSPVTLGANLAFEQGSEARVSDAQTVEKSNHWLLDTYASYKYSKDVSWRLTVANLLARDTRQVLHYVDTTLDERTSSADRSFRTVRLAVELKL